MDIQGAQGDNKYIEGYDLLNNRLQAKVTYEEDQYPKFGVLMEHAMHSLNDVHLAAKDKMESYVSGTTTDVHEVMVSVEKAGMAMDLALQIRNKMIDAYNELNRMQI